MDPYRARIPRRIQVTLDKHVDAALRRHANIGEEAAYVRSAILEKAARDELRGELDALRERVERLERLLRS